MRSFESSETKAIPALETPVMLHFVKDFARYLVKAIIVVAVLMVFGKFAPSSLQRCELEIEKAELVYRGRSTLSFQ